MIIYTDNQKQIPGDFVGTAILRSDCAPIPLTLELSVRAGNAEFDKRLAEGRLLTLANGDALRIIKSQRVGIRAVQGEREMAATKLVAVLDACHPAAFVRARAVIKENASLSGIYRAIGANVRAIDADFPAPRFYCPVGDTPTFHITRILQEEGGLMRWKAGKLSFMRLQGLFDQKPVMELPGGAAMDVESGFMERHQIPTFFSLGSAGEIVHGNRDKARVVRFSPHKNAGRLYSMTRCLLHRKTAKLDLNASLCAGDLVRVRGDADYAIITAAHVFDTGADSGGQTNTYTRLWLGSLEG